MPKIVDKAQMKKQIAEGALTLFSKSGFHNTSMAQIAAHLKMAKGKLYLYFDSKEMLIAYLMEAHFAQIRDVFMPDRIFESPDELFESVTASADVDDTYAGFIPVFFEAFGPSFTSDAFRKGMAKKFDNAAAYYAVRLQHLQQKGAIRAEVDPARFARVLVSMIDGIILHRCLFDITREANRQMLEELVAILKRGLISSSFQPENLQ